VIGYNILSGITFYEGEPMANTEQLEFLKQGVEVWNKWRSENPDAKIDLIKVQLQKSDLRNANLERADLRRANLNSAHLRWVDFHNADLRGANFIKSDLYGAELNKANLNNANLSGATLQLATLIETALTGADLTEAYLIGTDFRLAILDNVKMSGAELGYTGFGFTDLSKVIGLEEVKHSGPTNIGNETLAASKGQIPESFLRGCGLSDWEIESAKLYNPELSNQEIDEILYKIHDLRATRPLQLSPLFISYSHADSPFVNKIEEHLNAKGIRFWRDVHHATAGRLEKQIDRAIRHNPTVLLVLSENSIKSDWVEHEARTARELEKESGRDVLCPVALDDSWKDSPWPKRVMEQVMEYNILDFSKWEQNAEFGKLFKKLIDGLELFYK